MKGTVKFPAGSNSGLTNKLIVKVFSANYVQKHFYPWDTKAKIKVMARDERNNPPCQINFHR